MMLSRRGQMSVFILVAILIIAIVLVIAFRTKLFPSSQEGEFASVYDYYSSCISEEARNALSIAGSQGGRIDVGELSVGSDFAPFSSHLNFLGTAVPYWYYQSGNGLINEQVPTINQIESEVAKYIENGLERCDFTPLYRQNYSLYIGNPKVSVKINENQVEISINALIRASKDNLSSTKSNHQVTLSSSFGRLYYDALRVYEKEENDLFLEHYAEDALRLYTPVDGVELGCSPKVWKTNEVKDELVSAIEANIASIKTGSTRGSGGNNYFNLDTISSVSPRFLYSKNWPTKIEIYGTQGELMVASPLGNQQGLGAMGFCYAPYHFVYDLSFPVLVQFYDNGELFQFPVAVIIDKNLARNANLSDIFEDTEVYDACAFSTEDLSLELFGLGEGGIKPIDGNVTFSCFESTCSLGQTKNGKIETKAPSCLNWQLLVQSEGYEDLKASLSTNTEHNAQLTLDKTYSLSLNVKMNGRSLNEGERAIINFDGEVVRSAVLPEQTNISLPSGLYNISVYVYGNSSISIPASTKQQCVTVSAGGLLGMFGGTKEECFDINYPETKIEQALIGGGVSEEYLIGSDLAKGKLNLDINQFGSAISLEQLQYNYEAFENALIGVSFS